jgi:methyl-accepting chemotaxis protein
VTRWLNHLSIRGKVVLAFAAALICMLGLGLFAIARLSAVNANAADIRDNWMPSLGILGQMAQATERLRANQAALLLATADAERNRFASITKDQLALYSSARQSYQHLITHGEEQRLAEKIDATWKMYAQASDRFAQLMASGSREAALTLFQVDMGEAMRDFRDALQADIALQLHDGKLAGDVGEALGAAAYYWILAAMALTSLVCAAAGWAIVRDVSRPIATMTAAMRRLAAHDMTAEVAGAGRGDEIGAMAGAVQVFKDNMIEAARLTAEQTAEQTARERRAARLAELVQDFEGRIGQRVAHVSSSATQLEATAHTMTATASQTNAQATNVATAAGQASVNVQTVATAAEELSASISEITNQVAQSSRIAESAVQNARHTDVVVRALAESARKIGDVVGLISTIAGQTNLLALNATIEAARAGDAGKGFAVVASEVKSLASQTASATQEIDSQIQQIQTATNAAVTAIQGIVGVIEEVSAITAAIAAAVEEQGAATNEITRNVQQAAVGTQEVTSNIAGVSQAATETGSAASQVLSASGILSKEAEALSADVGRFARDVKAA